MKPSATEYVFTWNPADGTADEMKAYRDAAIESYPYHVRPQHVRMLPDPEVPRGKAFLMEPADK